MKLKINKACDLNSISVLPPHSRRMSAVNSAGPSTSVFGGGGAPPATQLRSQPSQQSLSQHAGTLSQFSQTSLDDIVTNEQRFYSQERENPTKRNSCLPPVSYSREDSQMPISRSSNNPMRKWSSNCGQDHKCQIGEELEHRMSAMETSLSRVGMILDSVQSDVMQVNRGTKELSLELESLRQKSTAHDDSLHLLNRGQEDIRVSIEGGLKSIADRLNNHTVQDKLQEIVPIVQILPAQIESSLQKLKSELCQLLSENMQVTSNILKISNRSNFLPAINPAKVTGLDSSSQMLLPKRDTEILPVNLPLKRASGGASIAMGDWNLVKSEKSTLFNEGSYKEKHSRISSTSQGKKTSFLIDSDEEGDGEYSLWLNEKGRGSYCDFSENKLIHETKQETKRILRKARRRKRRHSKIIVID